MNNTPPKLGEQEMSVLQFVAEHAPVTARDVVEELGPRNNLARTTLLTVLERLRRKGYVNRSRRDGIFHYTTRKPQAELLTDIVARFVERSLDGSVSPLIAYLSRLPSIPSTDLTELEKLLHRLRTEQDAASSGGHTQSPHSTSIDPIP